MHTQCVLEADFDFYKALLSRAVVLRIASGDRAIPQTIRLESSFFHLISCILEIVHLKRCNREIFVTTDIAGEDSSSIPLGDLEASLLDVFCTYSVWWSSPFRLLHHAHSMRSRSRFRLL